MTCKLWAMAAGAMVCVACAGLPSKPKPVQLPHAAPLDDLQAAGGGEWPAADWWKRYQDATLDRLIDLATDSSPTLATAHARYDSARQSVLLAGAASGVRVDANAAIDRQRLSDQGLVPPQLVGFHWYNQSDLGLQVSYTFDWWGKERDSVEAAIDQAHAAQADRSAAALLLASSVADAYFGWQADQSRLSLARARVDTVLRERAIAAARVKADLDPADELNRSDLALGDVAGHRAGCVGRQILGGIAAVAGEGAASAARHLAGRRQNRFDLAPCGPYCQPLARGSGGKRFGFRARRVLPRCHRQRLARAVEHRCG